MRDKRLDELIIRDPEIMGGTPVFKGTRVPVALLFDYLQGGDSLGDFLRGFPSVSREQAESLIEIVKEDVLELVHK